MQLVWLAYIKIGSQICSLIDFAPTCYIQCKEMQNCILFIIYKDNLYILFALGVLCTARKVLTDFAVYVTDDDAIAKLYVT